MCGKGRAVWRHVRRRAVWRHVRRRAVSEQKEKEKDNKKTYQMAAVSRHVFVSRRARRREKAHPLVSEQEGVPYAPVRERQSAENEKERKKGGASQSKGMSQSKGAFQSGAREEACPRAMWARECIPECGVKGRGRHRAAEG